MGAAPGEALVGGVPNEALQPTGPVHDGCDGSKALVGGPGG
jgi:hypothetical protein